MFSGTGGKFEGPKSDLHHRVSNHIIETNDLNQSLLEGSRSVARQSPRGELQLNGASLDTTGDDNAYTTEDGGGENRLSPSAVTADINRHQQLRNGPNSQLRLSVNSMK